MAFWAFRVRNGTLEKRAPSSRDSRDPREREVGTGAAT